MDRLPLVVLAGAIVFGCKSGDDKKSSGSRQRVQSVAASEKDVTEELCDATPGKAFSSPALADGKSLEPGGRWLWVNVWATWCKPCVEEMPKLVQWQKKWAASGTNLDLHFVSTDVDPALVDKFRADHPGMPATYRVVDADSIQSWLSELGADVSALPVHIFVAPDGKVKCVRASALEEQHERLVKALFKD
jgi:thiol-disulfide isomerase/thioredoxin